MPLSLVFAFLVAPPRSLCVGCVDIFCHFLGGILTCWYIVESWYYTSIWYLWVFFKSVHT